MCVVGDANSSRSGARRPSLCSLRISTPDCSSVDSDMAVSLVPPGAGLGADTGTHGDRLLDRDADEAAVLGPAAVVVADPLVAEQLVEDEPGVGAALADPAVGDDVLVRRDPLGLVQVGELVAALERAVLADG